MARKAKFQPPERESRRDSGTVWARLGKSPCLYVPGVPLVPTLIAMATRLVSLLELCPLTSTAKGKVRGHSVLSAEWGRMAAVEYSANTTIPDNVCAVATREGSLPCQLGQGAQIGCDTEKTSPHRRAEQGISQLHRSEIASLSTLPMSTAFLRGKCGIS